MGISADRGGPNLGFTSLRILFVWVLVVVPSFCANSQGLLPGQGFILMYMYSCTSAHVQLL